MEFAMNPYIVYVKTNASGYITAVNSSAFLVDTTGWIAIDEGSGDRYHHAQGNYFYRPIYEDHGSPVYKMENGLAVERTQAEIDADIAALPVPEPQPTVAELQAKVAELETALELLVSGATEVTE